MTPPKHEPYSSPLTWLIESASRSDDSYIVDLGQNDMRGACSCKWFVTSYGPYLHGKKPVCKSCRHILEARRRFTDWAIYAFAIRDKNKPCT